MFYNHLCLYIFLFFLYVSYQVPYYLPWEVIISNYFAFLQALVPCGRRIKSKHFSTSFLTTCTEAACIPQLKGSPILGLSVHGSLQLAYDNYFIFLHSSFKICNNIPLLSTREGTTFHHWLPLNSCVC